MNPNYDFHGQIALVSGASSGMGLATAQAFAQAGAAVVLADINEEAILDATEDLTTAGHQAIGVTCDVSDEDQAAAMGVAIALVRAGWARTTPFAAKQSRRARAANDPYVATAIVHHATA